MRYRANIRISPEILNTIVFVMWIIWIWIINFLFKYLVESIEPTPFWVIPYWVTVFGIPVFMNIVYDLYRILNFLYSFFILRDKAAKYED